MNLSQAHKDIEALVDSYLAEVKSKKSGQEIGKKLYSVLLRPVSEEMLKFRLIVVPDGMLHLLPFDALTDPKGKYVIHSHAVTYAPSATVHYFLRTTERPVQASSPFLGIGDVAYEREGTLIAENKAGSKADTSRGLFDIAGAQFPRLPATRQEVVSSAQIFGENRVVLLGKDATEAGFKSQPLEKFRILHLASVMERSPEYKPLSECVVADLFDPFLMAHSELIPFREPTKSGKDLAKITAE